MRYYLGRNYLRTLYVQADSVENVPIVTNELKQLLAERHRNYTDYSVENLAAVLGVARKITLALSIVLLFLAGVTLVISGVGIMNIMLVTVSERTREIGVRKAIGARPSEIRAQFLIEALIMSGLGALLGIAAAIGAEFLVQRLIPVNYGIHIPISGASIIAALLSSFATGIFFGYLPANQASKLEATESLRHE